MTPERLSEIIARRAAIDSLLPLTSLEDGDSLNGSYAEYDIFSSKEGWPEAYITRSKELAQFIVHAPQDIDDLLAEVKSLLWELRQKEEAD